MSKSKAVLQGFASLLIFAAWALPARAQALSPGTVGTVTVLPNNGQCPVSGKFYSGMKCYQGTMTGCPQTADLVFVFGYAPPAAGTGNNGTIVLFSGDGGTSASTAPQNVYAGDYVTHGYGVVEVAWFSEWENAGGNPNNGITDNLPNAACRPAAFLQFVRYNTGLPDGTHLYSSGGMCSQGISAGSAEIAYSLADYNAGSYLDKAEMESGPPFGNIDVGCMNPPPTNPKKLCPDTENGCQGWNGGITPSVSYSGGSGQHNLSIDTATGWDPNFNVPSCVDPYFTTGKGWDIPWDTQSIAPQLSAGGTYSYPNTSIQAWECKSTTDGDGGTDTLNNAGILGNYFLSQVSAPKGLNITAVEMCNGPEGTDGGSAFISIAGTGNLHSPYANQGSMASIEQDMANIGGSSQTKYCQNLH